MSDLKGQVSEAVKAALMPGPSQAEAYNFLENVKLECSQTWQACLEIFLQGSNTGQQQGAGQWRYSYAPEARMFGLQVVDDVLSNRFETIDEASVLAVQAGLLDYVKREYTQGDAEGQLFYLRNKVVHTLFLLFMQTYMTTWPDFFQAFFQLLPATNSSTEAFNAKTTDLLLRLLHETSTEISDSTLRLNKAPDRLQRDTVLRDAVRAKDAAAIADQVIRILTYAIGRIDSPTSQISSRQAVDLAEMAMRVLADYAPWIDISFIVTPSFLPLLFQCLSISHVSIRLASAELLYELVTKGMPATDKLELLRVLDVSNIITQLLDADDERKRSQTNGSGLGDDESSELYREKLARVLNGLGLELTRIIDEASATDEQKDQAKSAALAQRPLALRFLSDEYDDTSATVIPFFQSILTIYKKEKKRAAQTHLTDEKAQFLNTMLETAVAKMRYSSEEEWGGDDDDEDGEDEAVSAFVAFRKNLKMLYDGIAWIDYDLFASNIRNLVNSTLDTVDSGSGNLDWKDVEVALHALYLFGEPASKEKGTVGIAALVQVPASDLKKAKANPDFKIDYTTYPASVLGELMNRTVQSNVASWPHPSIPLEFFECICRYHEFFTLAPHTIPRILPIFVDHRGMHQEKQSVRSRCYYLFNRFIHTARPQLHQNLSGDTVTDLCERVSDLLDIQVDLPPPETPGEDVLAKAANRGSPFDSQLYLFEALGTLISMLGTDPSRQVGLLKALLEPLLSEIQSLSSPRSTDPESLLRLHHLIKAVGNVAYGFPELKNVTTTPSGNWVAVVLEAMRLILDSLKAKSQVAIIRESSVAARIGEAALPLVAPMIDCLVDQLTASELVDFLPFIGMLVHRYKDAFAEMLDLLLGPVFDRVYYFLEQPVTGTDDIQQHSELRRAYFTLLLSTSNANMEGVFASERNRPRLESLLNSIPHYLRNGALLGDQKVGFAVINRLLQVWVSPISQQSNGNGSSNTVPEFKQFVYERVVPLGLELPVRPDFDYSDAQAYQVIGEVSILYKQLLNLRQSEFSDYLSSQIFPSLAFPSDASEAFLLNLAQAADARQFKKWLSAFLSNAKKATNDKPYSVAHLLTMVPSAGQQ